MKGAVCISNAKMPCRFLPATLCRTKKNDEICKAVSPKTLAQIALLQISLSLLCISIMTNNAVAERWQACLALIRAALPSDEYNTWIQPLTLEDYKGGLLTVGVPTKFVTEYIRDHYRTQVAEAVAQAFGPETRLTMRDMEAYRRWEDEQRRQREKTDAVGQRNGKPLPALNPNLNVRYTFDNYVEGQSNRVARSVAYSIAEKPGQDTFNPFFLYGPSGVGKTHLVNAIGIRVKELYPERRVLFVSAHTFQQQYVEASISNKSTDFLAFYQSIDVLIIDDIQEIINGKKTQQTFFHIFNHLQQLGNQIILTCDRPPALFEGFEDRMLTRFKWGLVTELERPDTQLRRDILKAKIRRDGLTFPPEVVQYIAQTVDSSVRELEGIVNGIMAYSVADNSDITLELAARIVARIVNIDSHVVTGDDILSAICRHYGMRQRDVASKSRKQPLVQARQLAMYLCHKYTDLSYSQIGRNIGGRDHSTVLHACNQISRRLSVEKDFRREVEALEAVLKK